MRASKLGLLLLILGFGAIVETAWGVRGGLSIGPEGCRILTGRFVGPSFAFESEQLRGELPAELGLEVDNAFGSVRVAVGEADRARLRVRKVVFLPSEAKARAFAEKVLVSAELDGTTLRVTTNRRELERDAETARVGVETHLELLVPPATRVRVKNDHGRVEVSEAREALVESSYDSVRVQKISGAAEIDSRHGDVLVAEIGGPLKVTARHGDVEVGDVAGDTSLDIEYGDLRVARVARLNAKASQGDVAVEDVRGTLDVAAAHAQVSAARIQGGASIVTSYRDVRVSSAQADVHVETEHGEIDAQDVAGRLTVRSSSGQLVARRIGGLLEVTLSRGGVHAEALRQGALIRSSRDDVSLEDFAGPVEIRSRGGDIELRPLGPLASPITASTSSGQIQLVVPPAGRFELDARAPKGDVEVELPDFVVLSSGQHRVEGRRGEAGAALALSAERGSVRVAAAATPERQP